MSPKIVDRDEKRQQIAQAAIVVFGQKGFERTRMEDVAKEANVGKGTLYEYYKDKGSLLNDSFELMMSHFTEELEPQVAGDAPPLVQLRQITDVMLEAMLHLGDVYRFFLEYMIYLSRAPSPSPFLAEMLQGFRMRIAELLKAAVHQGTLRPDLDPLATAAAFLAWFDGAIFHWILLPETIDLREMADQFWEMTLRGILRDPSTGGE